MTSFQGTGGQILVEMLARHHVDRLSCVAGESYLPVLDALLDRPEINIITCRQEGGAGFIAEAWGKLTGRPGVCFVTRGPGVCNASIAIHTAKQDSTPLIVFMGQVRRWERGREAFQEVDVRAVFGSLAKWATEIDDPSDIPAIVNKAFHTAISGRPGPVVIGLPEDMLSEKAEAILIEPEPVECMAPDEAGLKKILSLLHAAQKPAAIIGGSGWTEEGISAFAAFARDACLPVAAAFRNQDLFDHRHDSYIGELGTGPNPDLVERIKESDLLFVMGSRLDEITTQGYALIDAPRPRQKLIHIHQDGSEIGKVFHADIGMATDVNAASLALSASASHVENMPWQAWRDSARHDYLAWSAIDTASRPHFDGADMTLVFSHIRDVLPADAIVTTDAGNFSGWAQRYLRYGRPGRLLAPISGAMGYAVPSAVGASIAHPDRLVLGICGDGGFMMTGQEIATAIHHGAKPIVMVCNNGMYGTIRMHQEKKFPGRISATTLTNPDFVALARSYGAFSIQVKDAATFPEAWRAAKESNTIAILEIAMDPRQITTRAV